MLQFVTKCKGFLIVGVYKNRIFIRNELIFKR